MVVKPNGALFSLRENFAGLFDLAFVVALVLKAMLAISAVVPTSAAIAPRQTPWSATAFGPSHGSAAAVGLEVGIPFSGVCSPWGRSPQCAAGDGETQQRDQGTTLVILPKLLRR